MKVKVCVGGHCNMMGSNHILDNLELLTEQFFKEGGLVIEPVECPRGCSHTTNEEDEVGPVVWVEDQEFCSATYQEVSEYILKRSNKI